VIGVFLVYRSSYTTYEVSYLDQTTRLPGLHVLSGEGTALVARAGTDRLPCNQLSIYCCEPLANAASLSFGFSAHSLAETKETLS
jgi:hypothetical protein